MPLLAVDHGEKRLGLAVSDVTNTIARPLEIIEHVSRATDAQRVLAIAASHGVTMIVIGESTDEEGHPNLAGRRARRFGEALRDLTPLPVVLWDESLSSRDALEWRMAGGASRKRRRARIDAAAAAVILQSYLDAQRGSVSG